MFSTLLGRCVVCRDCESSLAIDACGLCGMDAHVSAEALPGTSPLLGVDGSIPQVPASIFSVGCGRRMVEAR